MIGNDLAEIKSRAMIFLSDNDTKDSSFPCDRFAGMIMAKIFDWHRYKYVSL